MMGRESRTNPLTPEVFATREQRKTVTRKLAEATAHVLGGVSATLIVTFREPGTKEPTFSTQGYTVWGAEIEKYDLDGRSAIAKHHIDAARQAFEQHALRIQEQIDASLKIQEQAKKLAEDAKAGLLPPTEHEEEMVEAAVRPEEEAEDAAHE